MQKNKIGTLFQVTNLLYFFFNRRRFKAPATVKGLSTVTYSLLLKFVSADMTAHKASVLKFCTIEQKLLQAVQMQIATGVETHLNSLAFVMFMKILAKKKALTLWLLQACIYTFNFISKF